MYSTWSFCYRNKLIRTYYLISNFKPGKSFSYPETASFYTVDRLCIYKNSLIFKIKSVSDILQSYWYLIIFQEVIIIYWFYHIEMATVLILKSPWNKFKKLPALCRGANILRNFAGYDNIVKWNIKVSFCSIKHPSYTVDHTKKLFFISGFNKIYILALWYSEHLKSRLYSFHSPANSNPFQKKIINQVSKTLYIGIFKINIANVHFSFANVFVKICHKSIHILTSCSFIIRIWMKQNIP